jgi:hypothetical protein
MEETLPKRQSFSRRLGLKKPMVRNSNRSGFALKADLRRAPLASQAFRPEGQVAQQPFLTLLSFNLPTRGTDQDNAGNALTLNTFDIPASADGLFLFGKFTVAIPAVPLSRAADCPQSLIDIHRTSRNRKGLHPARSSPPSQFIWVRIDNELKGCLYSTTPD